MCVPVLLIIITTVPSLAPPSPSLRVSRPMCVTSRVCHRHRSVSAPHTMHLLGLDLYTMHLLGLDLSHHALARSRPLRPPPRALRRPCELLNRLCEI